MEKRKQWNHLQFNKPYQGIMANNKKKPRNYEKRNQNISLNIGSMIVTNPQYIFHQLNVFRKEWG
jgi:hypothetical protein